MTAALALGQQEKTYLSEVFPLVENSLKLLCFRLSPMTNREEGLRLSFRLSRQFPNVVVVWNEGCFYALAAHNEPMPSIAQWEVALTNVCCELPETGDRIWALRQVKSPEIPRFVISQLAEQILRVTRPCALPSVLQERGIEVKRKVSFRAELIRNETELSMAVRS